MNRKRFKRKYKTQSLLFMLLGLFFLTTNLFSQGFSIIEPINSVVALSYTGDKPQSKVWQYSGFWWAVIPAVASTGFAAGTCVWRLDGTTWNKVLWLDSQTDIKADVKSAIGVTHILLKQKYENSSSGGANQSQTVKLISIEFVTGSPPTYQLWSVRDTSVSINLEDFAETATIDIDGQGRMWLASDGGGASDTDPKNIYVKWGGYPYDTWSTFPDKILATGVSHDDICAITAFGGDKIGVLWSDEITKEFRFAFRNDIDNTDTWQTSETAFAGSIPGGDAADDHINLAVDSRNGTIYAAIKTGLDAHVGSPRIALLVRDGGGWTIYDVTTNPVGAETRPIVLLNEDVNIVTVCYTSADNGGNIQFKEKSIDPINPSFSNFPAVSENFNNGRTLYNNATSTKQSVWDESVILFSTGSNLANTSTWSGVKTYGQPISVDNGAGFAYYLNGADNQAITINKTDTLRNATVAITLEAWIKPNSIKDQQVIFNLDNPNTATPDEGYALSLTAAGKIKFEINYLITLESNSSYSTGTWTHIAATYDKSLMKIYINGILDTTVAYTDSIGDHGRTFAIGGRRKYLGTPIFDQVLDGSIDEIKVWNVARSIDDIQANMCKKIDETNLPSSLIAYWNFDNPRGLTIDDVSNNFNLGSLYNIFNFGYEWSGAPIGDEIISDYIGTNPAGFSVNLASSEGDEITVTGVSGTINGIQLYRADAPSSRGPLVNGKFSGSTSDFTYTDPLRYWGVKIIGSGTYELIYDYTGHSGISTESSLGLAIRDNLADDSWSEQLAILDTDAKTLTAAGLTGTEFALASGSDPLPVELSTFTAKLINKNVLLSWRTETEVMNYGFDIERSNDGIAFNKIGFIEGNGNSNSPKEYSFNDSDIGQRGKYSYRLKQIDNDGQFEYSDVVDVTLLPLEYQLYQNYPNPFNPSTKIEYSVPTDGFVSLKVYDVLGREVAALVNESKVAGKYSVDFNGSELSSGIYIYRLQTPGFVENKKMTLLR